MSQLIALIIGIILGRLSISKKKDNKKHTYHPSNPIISLLPEEIKEMREEDIQTVLKLLGVLDGIDFRFITKQIIAETIIREGSESLIFNNAYNTKEVYFINIPNYNELNYKVIYIFADKIYKDYGYNQFQYKTKIIKSIISSYYIYTNYDNHLNAFDDATQLEIVNHTNRIFDEIMNTNKLKDIMKFTGRNPFSTIFDSRH